MLEAKETALRYVMNKKFVRRERQRKLRTIGVLLVAAATAVAAIVVAITNAYAYGNCVASPLPLCMWPSHAICIDGGATRPDFYVCVKEQ